MFIGIDLGTTSVKALLVNKHGKIIKSVFRKYPIFFPKPLWAEQNPNDWWEKTLEVLQEITDDYPAIDGIGLSGQMHGLVVLDNNDKVIRPAILWNDQRTGKECEYLNTKIGQNNLSNYTANIALTGFTAPKILWMKTNEPTNFKKIKKIMLPKDYIAFKLSGVFATDVSDASGTLLFDVKVRLWSAQMLKIIGISEQMLPKAFESYTAIGTLKSTIASSLNLATMPKIIIGAGDQAAGAIGSGTVTNNMVSVTLGTSGVIFAACDKFNVDKANALHSFCHANGKYHLMGVMLNATGSLKWWYEDICQRTDYFQIEQEIKATPLDDTIYFLPYLMGERTPINNPNAKGMFIGMLLHHKQAHMTRAVIEGVCFGLCDSFEILKNLNFHIDKVRVIGGGAKNKYWLEILANVLNVDIELINSTEGCSFGAAILAMVGCGEYSSIKVATEKIIKVIDVIPKQQKFVNLYQQKYQKFKSLYPAVNQLY